MVGSPPESEQSRVQKLGPPKPPLGPTSSSFQVLPNTSYHEVGSSSSFPSQSSNENMVENIPSGTIASSDPVSVDSPANSEMGLNSESDIFDPKKLRRIMSNRLSAQRSRLKKLKYLANLETQAKTYEVQIAELEPQLASFKSEKQFLLMEHEKLDTQMEVLRDETFIRDAEIEKNKSEVNVLKEIQAKQHKQLQAHSRMLNWNNTLLEPVSNGLISNYYTNPYQGNGMGTPYMQMNNIIPEQSQMWIQPMPNNMHVINNLNFPNGMELMDPNLIREIVPNPNFNHHFS
ncbi:hypothetical protein VNO77_43349 [Canavalia gladiata]|uniref:BZIP domain-containing protein n=1 Tax=Canavalia gladiata TaxID=3824 RepID=A0AAN9JWA9_CANGL